MRRISDGHYRCTIFNTKEGRFQASVRAKGRCVDSTSIRLFLFPALRLGQGLVNRCNQLSQILRGGFMYDTEQIRPLFIFIA
jgi:hypothetical protein